MSSRLHRLVRLSRTRCALGALVPAIAVAAIGVPCACPDHDRGAHAAHAPHAAPAAHAPPAAPAAHAPLTRIASDTPTHVMSDGSTMTGTKHVSTRHRAAAAAFAGSASVVAEADASGSNADFHVGTPQHPLVMDGPAGVLAPGTRASSAHAKHGAPADLAKAPATDVVATRAALRTSQATAKLSKTCRKLVKLRSTKKLSKANKRRRTKCLAQRAKIIAESRKPVAQKAPGVAAPDAPIKGPAPGPASSGTTAPNAPTGSNPVPTPVPTPAPEPGVGPAPSGIDPSTVMCSAIGLTALDVDPLKPFTMSRAVACPLPADGKIYFELVNTDRQVHNLGVQTPGKPSTRKSIIDFVGEGERESAAVVLAPGTYEIVCMIPGHGAMTVTLTVLSKADYIAQGYAG